MVARRVVLEQLAQLIASVERPHPVRVAIDGIDAAGKTTLADELVGPIEDHGRPVIRASCDGFHRVRADRYERGRDSPEGYYHDSFDYQSIRSELLAPLGPSGSGRYRSVAFDLDTDSPAHEPLRQAPPDCVLLFDGVFLLRPELNDHWDFRVFVQVSFEEAVRRASIRDQSGSMSAGEVRARYWKRYVPGQRIYLETVEPELRADVVVENNDLENPELTVIDAPDAR